MAFIRIPTELLEADITPAQFKLCAYIIHKTIYNDSLGLSACFVGYKVMAEELSGSAKAKSSVIKMINDLLAKGILTKVERDGNKSSGITFNVDFELGGAQRGCLNNTDGCLNNTDGCLNNTLHIDLKFKNQDLKYINNRGCLKDTPSEAAEDNQIAPADGAAGRSMPIDESAKGVRAEAGAANIDATALWREYCTNQQDLAKDLEFVVYEGRYYLRRRCKYELAAHVRAVSSLAFFRSRGVYIQGILDQDFHYKNETIIGEVA